MLKKSFSVLLILVCAIFAASCGCSENSEEETNVPEEAVEVTETEASAGDSSDWCAVGSSWKSTNPLTGEEVTMKITGMENIDEIPMCKAVYETNVGEEDYSKIEYIRSEDGETYFWTAYNASGGIVSEISMKGGKMKMTDKEGNVLEYSQGQ